MSDSFWAYGSQLQLGDGGGPESFTAVAELTSIGGPSMARDSIDVSNHGSVNGWREFIPGFRDGGEVTLEGNWLPNNATQDESTGLFSTFIDDNTHNFKIVLPDSIATLAFAAFITAFEPDLPAEEQGQLSVTLKIAGAVTIT